MDRLCKQIAAAIGNQKLIHNLVKTIEKLSILGCASNYINGLN